MSQAPEQVWSSMDTGLSIVVLVTGPTQHGPHWFYAEIPPSRYVQFKEAEKNPSGYRLTDYARAILAHGPGDAPPPDIRRQMEEEHAVDHDFEEKIQLIMQYTSAALAAGLPEAEG